MAGNANSGNRNGGKSITEMIQRAAKKAIKQGEQGFAGKRSLAMLLDDLMQNDVQAFLKTVAPYVPREVIIDQTISIADALQEARNRVIDMGNAQIVQDAPQSILSDNSDPLLVIDQSTPSSEPAVSQGERTGWVGAES